MGLILTLVVGIVALLAITLLAAALIKIGVLALKIVLFGMLLLWLARKLFGGRAPRSRGVALVGDPIAEVPRPTGVRVRDKYDIAAERELDQELGL